MNNIEKNSVPADASRPLTATLPLRVIAGRGIVDAQGRVIANCQARMLLNGIPEWSPTAGYTFAEADDNAHGIAAMLNAHADVCNANDAMRAGLRYILEAANAASVGALHSDTFNAERVAQWARDALQGMAPCGEPPTSAADKLAGALLEIRELQQFAMTDSRGMRGDNGTELEGIISGAIAEYESSKGNTTQPMASNVPENARIENDTASDELIAAARSLYCADSDSNIEVDDDARISEAAGGTWVAAWVWVANGGGEA
jgi:hypothetical protein